MIVDLVSVLIEGFNKSVTTHFIGWLAVLGTLNSITYINIYLFENKFTKFIAVTLVMGFVEYIPRGFDSSFLIIVSFLIAFISILCVFVLEILSKVKEHYMPTVYGKELDGVPITMKSMEEYVERFKFERSYNGS